MLWKNLGQKLSRGELNGSTRKLIIAGSHSRSRPKTDTSEKEPTFL